jgi:hypothetical protein
VKARVEVEITFRPDEGEDQFFVTPYKTFSREFEMTSVPSIGDIIEVGSNSVAVSQKIWVPEHNYLIIKCQDYVIDTRKEVADYYKAEGWQDDDTGDFFFSGLKECHCE